MIENARKFDFDTPLDRSKGNSLKWCSRSVKAEGLTPLSVADMDFPVDSHIIEAMRQRLEHPLFGYEFTPDSLDDAFVGWQLEQHGFVVEKDTILHLPGVVSGIALAIITLSNPGDGVVIQPPVYPPFFGVVEDNERKLLQNPLVYDRTLSTWSMDLEGLEILFRNDSPKLMLLCNPHNPVGRVWKKVELKALCDLCHRYDVTLVSDDIHADFVLGSHLYTPLADAAGSEYTNYIQLLSPAKSFNIPGLGLAFALVPDADRKNTLQRKLRAMGLSATNSMAGTAVQAAYTHGRQWFNAVLNYIEENHQFFKKEVESKLPWARVSVAEGSFVAWVDVQDSGLRHTELAYTIRHDAKLMLYDGLSFGESGKYFFRFNLACPRTVLQGAVVSFVQALLAAKARGRLDISLSTVIDKRCCG